MGSDPPGRRLILLRHGESEWNAKNLFTGWADPPLTAGGARGSTRAGRLLLDHGLLPDVTYTSVLCRAIATEQVTLDSAGRSWIPVRRSWRLNGRHYGALQGRDKADVLREFGPDLFAQWRRSYWIAPPALEGAAEASAADPRYAALPPELLPCTESLADVAARLLPYWYDAVVPDLLGGATVLLVSHGNTLRALVKHLDQIDDDAIPGVTLPNAVPVVYDLDDNLRPLRPGGWTVGIDD